MNIPQHINKVNSIQVNVETPLMFPGNGEHQLKTGQKFAVKNSDNTYDWCNAYFRADYTFEALADRTAIDSDTLSAPINKSLSLIKKSHQVRWEDHL